MRLNFLPCACSVVRSPLNLPGVLRYFGLWFVCSRIVLHIFHTRGYNLILPSGIFVMLSIVSTVVSVPSKSRNTSSDCAVDVLFQASSYVLWVTARRWCGASCNFSFCITIDRQRERSCGLIYCTRALLGSPTSTVNAIPRFPTFGRE